MELGCLNVNILSQPWPRYNDLTLQAALLFFLNNLGTFSMLIIIYNDIFYPTHICAFRFGDCFNELSQSLLPSPLAWCNYVVQQAAPQDQVYIRHEHFPRHEEMPFFPLTDIIRGGGLGGGVVRYGARLHPWLKQIAQINRKEKKKFFRRRWRWKEWEIKSVRANRQFATDCSECHNSVGFTLPNFDLYS